MSQLILAIYILITSLGLIFIKLASASGLPISIVNSKLHFNLGFYSIAGLILYATSFVLYIYLISKYDLGYIIPLLAGFIYVIVFVASYFVFDEVFTPVKILAIALIIGGLVLLNFGR